MKYQAEAEILRTAAMNRYKNCRFDELNKHIGQDDVRPLTRALVISPED